MLKRVTKTLIGGFLMGTADLIPGVSGGTIALVIGIYERLVASIKEGSSALGGLLKANLEASRAHLSQVEWGLLVPLLAGILLAVVTLASFLETQLEERPVALASLFFGLVAGSVFIARGLRKQPTWAHDVIALLVGAVFFYLLGLGDSTSVQDPGLLVFFGAGSLAICAMILPGISGSLILVLVGMYGSVLGAVNDRDLAAVAVFALGAVTGLALFSQLLNWALRNHHDPVLAALIGLMIGSLRVVWPWPDGVDGPLLQAPASDWPTAVFAAVFGVVAVVFIARLGRRRDREGRGRTV